METPRRVLRNLHLENVQQLSTPLKIPASPLLKNLGYGTCVNVYKFVRSPKQGAEGTVLSPWAIKRVSKRSGNLENTDLFNTRIQNEAKILRQLSHPNIVGFRGVTKTPDGLDTLVLECCNSSLGSILEERLENGFGPLAAGNTIKMIKDVASALDYLHTEARLLHADLKSFNVLVKGEFEICKLCDFGVSLQMDENGIVNFKENPNLRYVGTSLWSAPEVMDEDDIIDCKADIFSFGLVIYETLALVAPHTLDLSTPTEDDEVSKSLNETTDESLEEYLEGMENACGTRPPLPQTFELTDDYNRVVEIFYCCTASLAEDRPTAKVILDAISKECINN